MKSSSKSNLKTVIVLAGTLSIACAFADVACAQSISRKSTHEIGLEAINLIQKNKSKQAEALIEKNIADKKSHPGKNNSEYKAALMSAVNLYRAYFRKPEKAAAYLETLIELSRSNQRQFVKHSKNLANLYSSSGKYGDAERVLTQWADSEKNNPMASIEPLQQLAVVQMNQNKLEEAGKNFEKVKSLYEKVSGKAFPRDFLVYYTRYLGLKGDTKNYKIYASKLKQATPVRKWDNCPACGMG